MLGSLLVHTVCMQLSGFILTAEGLLVGAQVGLNERVMDVGLYEGVALGEQVGLTVGFAVGLRLGT